MKIKFFLGAALLAAAALLPASALAQDSLPTWNDLTPGQWTMIPAGGDTMCSDGSEYSFFARPAATESDKLLIHFQGGGACWFGDICDPQGNPTYDPTVTESDTPDNYDGIFNFDNTSNPFNDYNMVFVPYCTADVHMGNADTTYKVKADGKEREFVIHHHGFANATAVLNWMYANVTDPSTVFVTGCSGGSIPAPFYAQSVAEAYPQARIEELGDASGSYRMPQLSKIIFSKWGTMDVLPANYSDETSDTLTFEDFYTHTAALFPDMTMTQYNTANDEVQASFLRISGVVGVQPKELQDANFADILASGDNLDFHTFTAGGNTHCITPTPDFYTYSVDGVSVRDWVAALAAGDPVETVSCDGEACKAPEIIGAAQATAEVTEQP